MRWRGYKTISQINGWRRSPLRKGIHYTFLFLLAAKIVGCTPVPPKFIDVSKDQNFRPATPGDIQNIEQAIAAVITAAKDSGYPSVGLSLWIYPSTESFTYWGRRRAAPSKVPAFTTGSNIHVNLEALRGRPWGSLIGLLAHEYGHVLHNSLSDYSVRAPHWFREGFAEWISSRILDSLSWQGADLVLRRAKLEIGAHPKFNLQVFHNKETWDSIVTNEPFGWTGTYTAAFLAVEQLIRKRGFTAAVDYFKTGQFKASFGQSYSSFEKEFYNSLIGQEPRTEKFSVYKPEWKVGFRWEYRVTRSGKIAHTLQEIVGIDTSAEVPVYLLEEGSEQRRYGTEKLDLLETRMNGAVRTRRYKSNELFAWPLQQKKQWRNTFKLDNVVSKQSVAIDRIMIVTGVEDIKVPAGTFKTIKIEAYDYDSGRLVSEYWFSPDVRWYVRILRYGGGDPYYHFSDQQLTAFRIEH